MLRCTASSKAIYTPLLVTASCFFTGCTEQASEPQQSVVQQQAEATVSVDIANAELEFWRSVNTNIQSAIAATKILQTRITQFLATPTQASMTLAQESLYTSQLDFAKLHGLKLLQINSPEVFTVGSPTLERILAHPIQPGYLDRFGPYQYSGLVFDIGFDMTADGLIQQHGLTDSEEVVLGIYAIEFMLMGENGSRSAQDYVHTAKLTKAHRELQLSNLAEIPNNRRRKLLELQTQQLVKDLEYLEQIFLSTSTRDMRRWRTLSSQQQISKIRASLESGITQSLISLANIQSKLNQNGEPDIAKPESTDLQNSPKSEIDILQNKISALLHMTSYLSDIEKTAADSALSNSMLLLSEIDIGDEEQTSKQLQSTYETLRSAI